ncbi:ComEC/Rec2 family competence protein [Paenarthrobacter sp. DKR-5]|uniref:ComEC/Rec2 family competence protein n=1 Tax=Paenarthrobacter sp. DKR-5 TaxID=2835535 RepID=UPI001BDC1D75|nr:ComEC/Rec2 family competence protein [Paenarthrobacter sp. DKR-5]MBT1001704.1 ComEC/Rec2 family competence protein [Paenarthrobacter sp. DKR-5]
MPAPWERYVAAARAAAGPAASPDPPPAVEPDGADAPAGERAPERARAEARAPERVPAEARAPERAQRADFRLVPSALAGWTAAWVGARIAPSASGLTALGLLTSAVLLLALCRGGRRRSLRAAAVAFALPLLAAAVVLAAAGARMSAATAGPVGQAIAGGATVIAELEVTGEPKALVRPDVHTGSDRVAVAATIRAAASNGLLFEAAAPVLVLGDRAWLALQAGERVRAAGTLREAEPGDSVVATFSPGAPPVKTAAGSLLRPGGGGAGSSPGPQAVRERFRAAAGWLWPEAAGLVPGMVVGDRSAIPAGLNAAMKETGLTHLTAVSGTNCSLVLGAVLLLCRSVRLPRRVAAAAAAAALLGFVWVVGPDASVLRAAVMGGIGLAAVLPGRPGKPGAALCAAVVLLLAADPWLATGYAFVLSVLATAGLVLFGGRCATWLHRWLPGWLARAVAVPLAAQLFCGPVLVLLQPQLTVYAVPANVLTAPLVGVVTIAGTASLVVLPLLPPAAAVLTGAAGVAAQAVGGIALVFAALPGAALPWPEGAGGVALMAALSVAGFCLLAAASHHSAAVSAVRRAGSRAGRAAPRRWLRRRAGLRAAAKYAALFVATALVAAALAAIPVGAGWLKDQRRWTIVACDVGQGDGLVVRTAPHSALVIDAGPDPVPMRRCLDDLAVTTVDLFVITHFHADHYGGTAGVLAGRKVRAALASAAGGPVPKTVDDQLRGAGVPLERASEGRSGTTGSVDWRVLWPVAPLPPPAAVPPNPNDSSIVLNVEAAGSDGSRLSALMTGDIEEDAAARLLARGRLAAVDVLKVAHHGARNGGSDVIRSSRAALALVSVGAGNDYGHPAPATLQALSHFRVQVARTDLQGRIYVDKEAGVLEWSGSK